MSGQTPPPLPASIPMQPAPFETRTPLPLIDKSCSNQPYPIEALGPLRAVVGAVQGETQAPLALVGSSALAIAAFAVQGLANVETLGNSRSPLSLYFLSVARSGERKSTVEGKLTTALDTHFEQQQHAHNEELRDWRRQSALWKQNWQAALKSEDDGHALDSLGAEPSQPRHPNRLVNDLTVEGLFRLFDEGMPSLALFSDEGGLFTGGHSMKQENRQRSLAILNSLWDGKPLHKTRGGDGHKTLLGRRLSLHLMVQPGVSRAILGDAQASDIGFVARCLVCFPESTIGRRLSSTAKIDQAPIEAFNNKLLEVLNEPMSFDQASGALALQTLSLSPEAMALLTAFSDAIEIAQLDGGDYAHITGEASKISEQAARIAGVLTLWADRVATCVPQSVMQNAITLARFYLNEAARLANETKVSAEIARAERLRVWLQDKWDKPVVVLRDIQQRGPNGLRSDSDAIAASCALLERHDWLFKLPNQTLVDGSHRSTAWALHPALVNRSAS